MLHSTGDRDYQTASCRQASKVIPACRKPSQMERGEVVVDNGHAEWGKANKTAGVAVTSVPNCSRDVQPHSTSRTSLTHVLQTESIITVCSLRTAVKRHSTESNHFAEAKPNDRSAVMASFQGSLKVEPFKVSIPDNAINEFRQLLQLSRIGPKTRENTTKAGPAFGVSREWVASAKERWLNGYDWHV